MSEDVKAEENLYEALRKVDTMPWRESRKRIFLEVITKLMAALELKEVKLEFEGEEPT